MRYNIYNNGNKINTIVADEEFCKSYCERNSYTYELIEEPEIPPVEPETEEPTAEEILNAIVGGMSYEQ